MRSHAQKHFIRLEKKGLGSVVPPARRKARWGDKQAPDSLDGSIDSDQELSAANRQTGSSSSMSTVDFYHTSTTAGSSAHCTEGTACSAWLPCGKQHVKTQVGKVASMFQDHCTGESSMVISAACFLSLCHIWLSRRFWQ